MEEFNRECAYWMTQNLSDHTFTPYPEEPLEILRYLENKRKDLKFEMANGFWRQFSIVEYFKEWSHAFTKNNSNLHWLKFMKKHIPVNDKINHRRIDSILATHPQV